MSWFKEYWFKVGILLVILLAIYFTYRFANNYLDQQKTFQNQQAAEQKIEKDRAYAASQKETCLAIYKQESSKWNNVSGWRYDESKDKCYVQYKQLPPKTSTECDAQYRGSDGVVPLFLIEDWSLCRDGLFETAF